MIVDNDYSFVKSYLKEINRTQLLSQEEEIQLSRQIRDFLELGQLKDRLKSSIGHIPTNDELVQYLEIDKKELHHRLYQGRLARNKMIQANLRLVYSVAKKYLNRGLSFQDLIQEGNLGLIRAVDKFDPKKGYRLSTYATILIKQALLRAIYERSRIIRLPISYWNKLNQIKKITKNLCQTLGRMPTESEIVNASDIDKYQLRFIIHSANSVDSIDRTIGENQDISISDFIAADQNSFKGDLFQNLLFEELNLTLNQLPNRDAEVIRLHYGLSNVKKKTLLEISKIYNLSPEAIRQIENKALIKLRNIYSNSNSGIKNKKKQLWNENQKGVLVN